MKYSWDFLAAHTVSFGDFIAGDFMSGNFLAWNFLAHHVHFGDCMAGNFLDGDFLGGYPFIHINCILYMTNGLIEK